MPGQAKPGHIRGKFAGFFVSPQNLKAQKGGDVSNFHNGGVLLVAALTMGLAACGGGSIAPRTAATSEPSQPAPADIPQASVANNTSAADSFKAQANGNESAGNVSKVSIRSALKIPSSTPIWAHLMVWFGQPNHMDVGYDSADPNQVHKQLDDMQSRGIQGAIIDWYGTDSSQAHVNAAATTVMEDAQGRDGFQFAIMEDAGGGPQLCAQTPGCNITDQVIADLNYVMGHYTQSPAYIQVHGHPAIFFFGLEQFPVDWNKVRGSVKGKPLFIFRNAVGFQAAQTDGGFSWVNINTADANDWGQAYLDSFYAAGLEHGNKAVVGSGYKGFNDKISGWGMHRVLNQNCGQTWLATLDEIGKYYGGNPKLSGVQLVTWNDYEEGTEIESGIDNCVSISAQAAGNSVAWQISGDEKTIDHYSVWTSSDGQNFDHIVDVSSARHSADLASANIHPGSGAHVYVQAVGRPSIRNHMSGPVTF